MKTVIITGGTKGIGAEIAKKFMDANYKVIIGARKKAGLALESHRNLRFYKIDVREESGHNNLINKALESSGSLDCYINCAGFSQWSSIYKVDDIFWNEMVDTNLKGTFWGCKAAATFIKSGASIINISSLAGKRGSANNTVYCATKFGINGITQSLAKELGSKGIRVNAVCPVYVETSGLIEALDNPEAPSGEQKTSDYLTDFTINQTALKRLPKGTEVADLCVYLASESASAITGQCINVDCGVLPQ